MLRLLHIGKFYPPHPGGIETHLRDLATRQTNSIQVSVVVSSSSRKAIRERMDEVSVVRVPCFGTFASMPLSPRLAAGIRTCPAEIVHLHTPNPGAALALLLSGHKGKVVITHHADTLGRPFLRKLSDPFVRAAMDRASAIIVTSSRYLASSPELAPYKEKCRVVPLAIDPALYSETATESQRIREQFGERILLSVGRLVPYKGFRFAIEAMAQVDGHLCIIGSGPEDGFLRQLARERNVADKVTFLGRVDDLRPYYQAARAFVLPSVTRAEAFGVVQLEAMASGTPVINTDLDSGVPEVGVDGVSALTVPPGNAAALAKAMNSLLDDPGLRDRLAAGARQAVQEKYSLDRMVRSTFDVYQEVLGAADKPASL